RTAASSRAGRSPRSSGVRGRSPNSESFASLELGLRPRSLGGLAVAPAFRLGARLALLRGRAHLEGDALPSGEPADAVPALDVLDDDAVALRDRVERLAGPDGVEDAPHHNRDRRRVHERQLAHAARDRKSTRLN